MTNMAKLRVRPQTWGNVAPYPETTLWHPSCSTCGWQGQWWCFEENAEREAKRHSCEAGDTRETQGVP